MKNVSIVDVTLRDGGTVNNFNFGQKYMDQILQAQEASGVEFIELGYVDQNHGSEAGRTQFINENAITQSFLKEKKNNVTYLAMFDYGKFNPDNLTQKTPESIDGFRVAFHKKNRYDIIDIGRKIIDKGYKLFIQPMITLRYSDAEIIELIDLINKNLPDASGFYIVDSFGEMRTNDMNRMINLIDHNLISSMPLGFHSHNNLQMSYSNAVSLLQFPTNRELMLDSSIMGMGKGAGNLNTELLLEHLNIFYGKTYKIEPLLEVIDKVINQLHSEYYWGYAVEYYLSSINHCTPSYASHFYNKHMLPIDEVGELLGMIAPEKKISFDKNYAEELYRTYNESKTIDDSKAISTLINEFKGKKILLVAPGKSVSSYEEEILQIMENKDIISIGLNATNNLNYHFLLTTRLELFLNANQNKQKIITTSNVAKSSRGDAFILDYKKWIEIENDTHDSSSVIALNLLAHCGVNSIILAGFDGFSSDINENYYDTSMRHPITPDQATRLNAYYKRFIEKKKKMGIDIMFLTPSKY